MNVNFYKINKKVNSTLIPSGDGTQVNVVLKSPSSIINPRFELNQYLDVNYCYVAEFNRYYFINEIRYENPLWIYSCNVDVLASFKAEIGASTKYVLRSASSYDLKVKDNIYSNKDVFTINEQVDNSQIVTYSNGYFVVGVVGTNATTGGSIYYQMTPNQFSNLLNELFISANGYQWGDLTDGIINSIMNPFQYITSVMWYPFSFGAIGTSTIKSGNWNTNAVGTRLSIMSSGSSYASFTIPKHPKASTRGEYLNDKPYSKYVLEGGYFGMIDIPNELLFGKDVLAIGRNVDFTTGMGTFKIYASGNNESVGVASIDCQVGVPVNISADSNGFVQMLTGGASLGLGLATGNPFAITSGVEGLIGGGLSSIAPSISTKGSQGTVVNNLEALKFRGIFYDIVDEDLNNKGRPLCQMKTINTLSGYLICEDGNINSNATEQEKESIASYLTSGFYYE